MKILIAPDAFKDCLSASQVADAIVSGFEKVLPDAEYIKCPMADGGEGTVEVLVNALHGRWVDMIAQNPLGKPIQVRYGLLPDQTAVIEMAQAAGLQLLDACDRHPYHTSTYGVGQMAAHALANGAKKIVMGIGGSASNDGGVGFLQALGLRLLDKHDQEISAFPLGLKDLHRIDTRQLNPLIAQCEWQVMCDVNNPLCGPLGASHVFGGQKGASLQECAYLDSLLAHWADVVVQSGVQDYRQDAGVGAAGGLGFALKSFCGASLQSGVDRLIDMLNIHQHIQTASLIITGEGRMDEQTLYGKVPLGLLRLAQAHQVPILAIAGGLGQGVDRLNQAGFAGVFPSVIRPMSLAQAIAEASFNLSLIAQQIAGIYRLTLLN